MSKEMSTMELQVKDVENQKNVENNTTPPMVAFSELRYEVFKKDKTLTIINNVSSTFEGGEMTAVFGSSGAGKTTLLDLIAGRRSMKNARMDGSILFAGAEPNEIVRKRYTGYCEQFDTLVAVLTVRETLECTAELKCSEKVTRAQKVARVQEVMHELGIEGVADSLVGNPAGGSKFISGGQRKRVNIANSLITKPPILLLDEPTTGLDSATADDVLRLCASLARDDGSRAVAATVHSPSSRAFRLYVDKVLCLGYGGRVLFSGAPGIGRNGPLCMHLDAAGAPSFTEGDSLADHMMSVFGGGVEGNSEERSLHFSKAWNESPIGKTEQDRIADIVRIQSSKRSDDDFAATALLQSAAMGTLAWHPTDKHRNQVVATGFWQGFKTLFYYRSRRSFVDPEYIGARLGDKILYGFIMATLWWGEASRQRRDDQVNNVLGLLWFICVLPGYGASAYIPQLILDRPVFLRESADGCYWSTTYLFAKMVEEFLAILPLSLIFMACLYGACSLQGNFLVVWIVNYLMGCWGVATAYWIASISPNVEAANAILPTIVTWLILFAGYLIIISDVPLGWRWLCWCNPMFYAFVALVKNEYRGTENKSFSGSSGTVIKYYSLERAPGIWSCIAIVGAILIFFIFLADYGLRKLALRK